MRWKAANALSDHGFFAAGVVWCVIVATVLLVLSTKTHGGAGRALLAAAAVIWIAIAVLQPAPGLHLIGLLLLALGLLIGRPLAPWVGWMVVGVLVVQTLSVVLGSPSARAMWEVRALFWLAFGISLLVFRPDTRDGVAVA